jgi:hypothetical protein
MNPYPSPYGMPPPPLGHAPYPMPMMPPLGTPMPPSNVMSGLASLASFIYLIIVDSSTNDAPPNGCPK